jgi:hypothetical protein
MSLQNLVAEYIRTPLTGDEINTLVGCQPILYSDLKNYKKLEDVLQHTGKPYAIILYQTSSYTNGHYNAIGVNFQGDAFSFDPYGFTEIETKQNTPYDEKLPNYVTPMLEDYVKRHPGKKVVINKVDFQSKAGGVADCGRHASLAALFSKSMTFEQMQRLYFTNTDPYLKGDVVATILTLMSLNDIGKWYKSHK